jgi:hypothetical protein
MVIVMLSYLIVSFSFSTHEGGDNECRISSSYCIPSYSEVISHKLQHSSIPDLLSLILLLILLSRNFRNPLTCTQLRSRSENDPLYYHLCINAP